MTTISCAGVLFDCDGVLVDSDASVVSAWTRWARARELDPEQVLSLVHGQRSADTVAQLIEPRHRTEALAQIDRYEIEDARAVEAIPGALELTASIRRERWAVVTSGTRALATARLRAAGIPLPDVLVTADDVQRGKPDPEGYLLAARQLGVPAGTSIVLEDALTGIRAARAAGVAAVVGVGGRGLEDEADLTVRDLRSLRWANGALHATSSP